ncbi:hypothetical protein GIB67_014595 [Kingdonia uniflora]|uniref:Uncharacterized protein n=1 Tax=Kingdonia uniflora TaxID=39325 RepID=A0A7J7MP00_9MAGN|nr:hypothetical protein GIB67_014595 [Kingdonia uniflora]
MLQCIFLLSDSGEVMLEKQLSGHQVDRSICGWFWQHVLSQGDSSKSLPVIASPTHYLFQVVRDGITFLACTQVEMPPLMAIESIRTRISSASIAQDATPFVIPHNTINSATIWT